MPSKQSKRIFVGGLDKDVDPRLVKNGDYHHGLNIRNISSEGQTQGVIENIKGTKKIDYDFPKPPTSGKRRITLFMPSRSYFFNYGGSSLLFGQSIVLENFDGHLRDENDPYTTTEAEPAIDVETGNINLDEDGLAYNVLVEQTTFPFPAFYLPSGLPATFDDTVINFDISIGFSLAEMQNPTNNFQIAYNGETHINMLNYLTFWVSQNQNAFANLGIAVSVIDNNSPYFDNEYFFGQSTLNNITNHPDYTPGQVWAHALLFEGAYSTDGLGNEEGVFYVDLKKSSSTQPLYLGAPDSITGSLFTEDSNGLSPYFLLPENVGVEDGYGYANEPSALNDSTDWSVADTSEGDLVLTEYINQVESVGWTINFGETVDVLGHPTFLSKTIIRANATIVNDTVDTVEATFDTIGTYEDKKDNKIYWMVASNIDFHLILEYDLRTDTISTVFRDCGNSSSAVFNWRKEFLINDINKVGDVLYWTSRQYGEPCSINVRKSKNSMALIDSSTEPYVLDEEGGTDNISLEDYYPYSLYDADYPYEEKRHYVEVLKRNSLYAPTYTYVDDANYSKNNLYGHMYQFRYRYHYYDNEVSPWSPISDVVPSIHDKRKHPQNSIDPFVHNRIDVAVKNSSGIVKEIELAGLKCKDLGNLARGNRGEFFTIAKINNDFSAWQIDNLSEQTISFYNDQLYRFIDAGSGDRLFDSVPRSANTQTIIGNTRLAYGNYTQGFDVPKINIKTTPQYGYVQGDPNTYGGPTYQDDVDISLEGGGVSSFKSGAFHSFGLVYFDERGRCSTVLIDDESQVYVKFPSERTSSDSPPGGTDDGGLYGAVTIGWSIFHKAPSWAKYYRWYYSRNNTVDEFVQFRLSDVFVNNFVSSDTRIFISLRNLKGADESYISTSPLAENNVPNPMKEIFDYDFVKGDRIRFITGAAPAGENTTDANVAPSYIDVKIAAFEYYSQSDPTAPILNASGLNALPSDGSQDAWFLIIDEVLDSDGNVVAGYNKSNFSNITRSIVEIYRPKQEPDPDETVYFEFSKLYEVQQPLGTHLGDTSDQSFSGTTDAFGNFTSNSPATGQFLTGDVYYKSRDMLTPANNFYIEDYFCNDLINTNHFSIGRANLFSPYFKEFNNISSITYSDVYQPATSFNGLSTFDPNTDNVKHYSEIDGSIQKIYARDTNMLVIHEDKTYNVPVAKDILLTADNQKNVTVSNKVLGQRQAYSEHYGISKNPESFVVDGNVCYWTDIRSGVSLRLKQNGITTISSAKMIDYFRDKSEEYKVFNPEYKWEESYGDVTGSMLQDNHKDFRIKGGFNPKHDEYIIQFPRIVKRRDEFDNTPLQWDVLGTVDTWESEDKTLDVLASGEVVSWAELQKRWITFYSHVADYYGKINVLFTSWENGALFLHDMDDQNHNTFYGVTYNTELDFFINEGPSTVKGFKSITLEANQEVESTEDGVEEEDKSSYDLTLITDMTETSIDRRVFDERENKQYAQIPFVTTNSTGSEIIGLGAGTGLNNDAGIGVIAGSNTNFGAANIILGTSTDVTSPDYGDQLFFNDGTSDVLVGTISDINSDNSLTLSSSVESFDDQFLFIKRPAISEGDRMKGRFMEVKLKKRSKKLLEIFSGSATIFNSELSDD